MTGNARASVRLKVSPTVAHLVREAPRELRIEAARGVLPLSGEDLLTTLFFLAHGEDAEIRTLALESVRRLPDEVLAPILRAPAIHPQLLDFVAQLRLADLSIMEIVLTHSAVSRETLRRVASRGEEAVLSLLAGNVDRLRECPEIVQAVAGNPRADWALRVRFAFPESGVSTPAGGEMAGESLPDGDREEGETFPAEEEVEELNLSKYKMALQLEVAEKIKLALTGDKEWRAIFLKDTNKLVSSAVLKNPRITEGEVLGVAKNKSAHDELIRLITLNQEWIKNYEIQKALVYHPRTPLPKALRYMNVFTPKDLKTLAKSRGVSQVLVNNARRILMAKEKNR